MKKYLLFIIFSVSISLYGELQLNDLPYGSYVEVSIASQGCFHNSAETLIISSGVKYTAKLISSKLEVELTQDDVKNLDKNLEFYRDLEGYGGCTSVDEITYNWKLNGEKLHEEKYIDGTCSLIFNQEDGMTFVSLINNLKKLQPPNKSLNQDVADATPIS